MAKGHYIQEGKCLDYKNDGSADIKWGDIVALTNCIGVAECDIPKGETGALSISGVYELPADSSTAFTMGQTLYWDGTNNVIKGATASGLIQCGIAAAPKATAGATCLCKLG